MFIFSRLKMLERVMLLPHPEHKKFGELLGKLDVLDEAFVVDFQVSE